jgi:hypothetical protein
MRITQAQAQALASFISRVRTDWDHPGVVAAITKAAPLGTPADIGTALCRLAANAELRTPAILADPGTHWADTTVAKRTPPVMCPEHSTEKAGACRVCIARATPPPADWRPAPTRTPRTHARPTPERPSLDATRARADEEQK